MTGTRISDHVGAATHARALLGGEPLLWAAFSSGHSFDVRGLDPDGKPRANLALRALDTVASGMSEGMDAGSSPSTQVVIFGKKPDCLAARHGGRLGDDGERVAGPRACLWALTPHRLHVSTRLTAPPPEREGLVKGLVGMGKEIGGLFARAERPTSDFLPLRPAFDVPRAEIARLELVERGLKRLPRLRMELVDGSGFEFAFHADRLGLDLERDQYERLLALSLGAPE